MNKKEFSIWIAGFIDGEGSIGISRRDIKQKNPSYKIFFCITNTDKQVLEKIKKFFKVGSVRIKKKSNNNRFGNKDCYDFALAKRQARIALEIVYPYLQVKKKQAKLVLNFPTCKHIALKGKWGGRMIDHKTKKIQEKMYWQSRKLNSGTDRFKGSGN